MTVDTEPVAETASQEPPSTPRRPRLTWSRQTARPADHPHTPLSSEQFIAFGTVATIALLAVWFVVYALGLSSLQEHHRQRVLYAHLRSELALATVPIGGEIKPGVPVALINAPSIDLHNLVVVEGTSSNQLEDGPGHLPDTPLPGQAGFSQIFGRSTTFGAPFGSLGKMRAGQKFSVTTGQGVFTYTVLDVRRPGDTLLPAADYKTSGLTFVTSQSRGWTHGWRPGSVLYVDANLTGGKIQPTPSGRPVTVASADQPFHGSASGLIKIVLWLQLLVIGAAATVWAWVRWSKPQTWFVAVPVGVALLWALTSAAFPLLPNLS